MVAVATSVLLITTRLVRAPLFVKAARLAIIAVPARPTVFVRAPAPVGLEPIATTAPVTIIPVAPVMSSAIQPPPALVAVLAWLMVCVRVTPDLPFPVAARVPLITTPRVLAPPTVSPARRATVTGPAPLRTEPVSVILSGLARPATHAPLGGTPLGPATFNVSGCLLAPTTATVTLTVGVFVTRVLLERRATLVPVDIMEVRAWLVLGDPRTLAMAMVLVVPGFQVTVSARATVFTQAPNASSPTA